MTQLSNAGRVGVVSLVLACALAGAGLVATSATPISDASPVTGTAAGCPITQPNNVPPPPHLEHYVSKGGAHSYFEDGMWVGVGNGEPYTETERFLQADGSLAIKHWWTRGDGVRGRVIVFGQRLDGDAPPLRQGDIERQYGSIGFTPLTIIFPTAGCWEVTGTTGAHSLTFVVFLEEPYASATPAATPMP